MPIDDVTLTAPPADIRLEERFSGTARAALALLGAALVLGPAYDLRAAFLHIGWWTIFFGIIVGGAVAIGATLLFGAAFGAATIWRLEADRLIVVGRTPFQLQRLRLTAADITSLELVRHDWDSGSNTFTVKLHLAGKSRSLVSPPFADEAAAARFLAEVRRRLDLDHRNATLPRDDAA